MLLAVNFIFLVSSVYLDDRIGQIFALLVLTVAAAETSIGLGILILWNTVRDYKVLRVYIKGLHHDHLFQYRISKLNMSLNAQFGDEYTKQMYE